MLDGSLPYSEIVFEEVRLNVDFAFPAILTAKSQN
jgi:hypothetical protein